MTERQLDNETRYQLLRHLETNPGMLQRELAKAFGISLGKTNYCLRALLNKGYIKAVANWDAKAEPATEIRQEGMQVLLQTLGDVDAERFLSLLLKEPFDYTQWQRALWQKESVDAVSRKAHAYRQERNEAGLGDD